MSATAVSRVPQKTLRHIFYDDMMAATHRPENMVWANDAAIGPIQWSPALVITEENSHLLTSRSKEDMALRHWSLASPNCLDQTLVVMFIFDREGPAWTVSRVVPGKWKPFSITDPAKPIQRHKKRKMTARYTDEFYASVRVARSMINKALKRQRELDALMNNDGEKAATPDPTPGSGAQPRKILRGLTQEAGVLAAGDEMAIVRQGKDVMVRVVSVDSDDNRVVLDGPYVLREDEGGEHVFHSDQWQPWTALTLKTSVVESTVKPLTFVQDVKDAFVASMSSSC